MSTNNNNNDNKTHDVNDTGVQTDEKKQHFDDIYICDTPVPYKIRILDDLSYVSDDFNREMFDTHIVPIFENKLADNEFDNNGMKKKVQYVDLCACFGNTTMAALHQMSYDDIRENWSDETRCQIIDKPRRTFNHHYDNFTHVLVNVEVTAIDISPQAMAYGKKVGLYDTTIVCDLNNRTSPEFTQTKTAMGKADIVISTAALVYLELDTIEVLIEAFANGTGSDNGRMLVNFLNPFALKKADATKRILLSKLEFVASRATRHRRMSPLEQENYPGEEWSLLELWVLQKKKK
mmetsp:Transcript_48060/g.54457  ORF Transcript_48060/g.54457 Transcript_48060/m.54457 type:complete len:292 (+) Transcript_48060:271-1146(+)